MPRGFLAFEEFIEGHTLRRTLITNASKFRREMGRTTTTVRYLHLILLYFLLFISASHGAEHLHRPGCRKRERDALLSVKRRITDPANFLSSWHGDDCCSWRGVACDARTGHVVRLDLGPSVFPGDSPAMGGDIDPSLANLTHLTHLDLSSSTFNLEPFFPSIGSLTELVYLNLSQIFNSPGKLHPQLGNLSSLRYLYLNFFENLEIDNFQWLSGLSSLQLLDLSSITLDKVADWLTSINMVPTLAVLHLPNCYLPSIPTSVSHNNLTSLSILDLSDNGFDSPLPDWLFNMTSLEFLDLQSNSFHGRIPVSLGNMTSLEALYIDDNELQGEIPASLGNICNLRQLDLSVNNVTEGIDELLEVWSRCRTIGLEELNLGYNNLTGGLPPRIEKLTRLRKFSLAHNHMSGTVPKEIGQLSRLESMSYPSTPSMVWYPKVILVVSRD